MTKSNSNTVVGLRACAHAIGITRKQLQRFMAEGMPHARKSERLIFDLEECRAWIAINDIPEADAPALAPVLHPSDPRYRELTAAAAIRLLENELEAGRMLLLADVQRRAVHELGFFVSGLLNLYPRVAADVQGTAVVEVQRAVDDAVNTLAAELTCDKPGVFGNPSPMKDDDTEESPSTDEGREVLKLLAPPDPRFDSPLRAP